MTHDIMKCVYYDKGYCRNKDSCSLKHPRIECDGCCEDKRTCPKRHRTVCKNGDTCVFLTTQSCEFLHKPKEICTKEDIESFQSMINIVEDKIKALDAKERKTVNNIEMLMENMKGVAGKLESLSNSQPDNIGEWSTKVTSTESKVKCLVEKVDDIEEEYANKLDEQEKHIASLEGKISNLECQILKLVNKQESKTYKYIQESNTSNTKRDEMPRNETQHHNITTIETQEKCEICQKICKSGNNMKEHDENYHIKNNSSINIEYKCDQCILTFKEKSEVSIHIINMHKKCIHCRKIFTTEKLLETHIKAIHKKENKKHNIEREPSLKNHKIKK